MKKVAFHNLGCKVNAYETEAMQEMLEDAGYEIVPFQEGADIYVINTCTVTNIADRKSRQMLHRARKMNPEAIVVAAGCYVQAQEAKEEIDPCIDIVIGNNKKQDLLTILQEYEAHHAVVKKEVIDINHTKEYEELHLSKTGEHTRAYIKVQDGCNQFCSYCIIPYARGRVRSRRPESVVEEVRHLAENGYREVVLTGIHLSSYGIDLEEEIGLLELIREVHKIDGICRIRLGSLEPRIITESFAKDLSEMEKICPRGWWRAARRPSSGAAGGAPGNPWIAGSSTGRCGGSGRSSGRRWRCRTWRTRRRSSAWRTVASSWAEAGCPPRRAVRRTARRRRRRAGSRIPIPVRRRTSWRWPACRWVTARRGMEGKPAENIPEGWQGRCSLFAGKWSCWRPCSRAADICENNNATRALMARWCKNEPLNKCKPMQPPVPRGGGRPRGSAPGNPGRGAASTLRKARAAP